MLAAQRTRELIAYRAKEIGTLISVYPEGAGDFEGLPIGLQEYYAPYPDSEGDLLLLGMPIATIFRNALPPNRANLTLSIADLEGIGDGNLAAGRMRIALFGTLEPIPAEDRELNEKLRKAYELSHPDARGWDLGQAHSAFWARFVVNRVYVFGGFGNVAYLGFVPIEEYRKAGQATLGRNIGCAVYELTLVTHNAQTGKRMRSHQECLRNWPVPQQPEDGFVSFAETSEKKGRFQVQW
ncbi:hypothetical protein OIV83_000234 [Microbotryomycetes sp. JL201]|nr:hypothetical protein OIV83_000234 [Microbotryomycetes sp. JL201]